MIKENQIEKVLEELFSNITFPFEPQGLYSPLRYMMSLGGKRVRPRLCLLAYGLFKDNFSEEITSPAEAIEVFHGFTLLHDDIMDNSPLRRGKATVWKKWDENTAILSGDVMCIESYRRLSKAPADVLPKVLELFTTTAMQVCEGQQLDMDFESCSEITIDDYIKMIGLKTAVLIACSAKMGALIAGQDEVVCNSLYDYAYDLGLAFQIADDYLDTFGDSSSFGKPIGGDILNEKKTWLLIKAMEKCPARVSQAMSLPAGQGRIDAVRELYSELGVDEDAKYEIIRYHSKAMEHIDSIGLNKVRVEMLHRYADRLIGRTK